MFAVYVYGSETEKIKRLDERPCSNCREATPFNLVLKYRFWQLFIFGVVLTRQYFELCAVCGHGRKFDRGAARRLIKAGETDAPDIPIFRRYGLLMLALLVAMVMLPALLSGS